MVKYCIASVRSNQKIVLSTEPPNVPKNGTFDIPIIVETNFHNFVKNPFPQIKPFLE